MAKHGRLNRNARRRRASSSRTSVGREELASTRRSLRKLAKALELVTATGDTALADAARFRTVVEHEYERHAAVAAMKDNVFRDLVLLDKALDTAQPDPEELRRLRMVPAAVLRWITTFLHVEPHLELGAQREIAAESVSKYEWRGDAMAYDLMTIRVVAPGWKWRERVLAKPMVEIV